MENNTKNQIDRIRRYSDIIQKQTGIKAVRPDRFERYDGWINVVNRYGTKKDVSEQYQFALDTDVDAQTITQFYEGDGLFAKIIDTPAEEAIKHGFSLDGLTNENDINFYTAALDELDWEETAITALKWSRLFGGALVVMLINDGRQLDEPVDWQNIQSIDDLRVYERAIVEPDYQSMMNYDPQNPFDNRGSRLGMPEYYTVYSKYGEFRVHDSRCLVFRNGVLPENATNSHYEFWGVPEYLRVYRAIRDAEIAHTNGPKMLERSVQPIYKMRNLAEELATEEGENKVLRRLETIDLARGFMNTMIIDADGEDYDFKSFQYAGVANIVDSACNYLSAITNIPQTILFGRSPAGMNATGESDFENFYNFIERIQKRVLKTNIRYLLSVIFQAGMATGEIEEIPDIKISFNPLWSMSDVEKADFEMKKAQTESTKAQTANTYITAQVISPEEVRKALADSDEYDIETMLDDYSDDEIANLPQAPQQQGQEEGAPPPEGGMMRSEGGMPLPDGAIPSPEDNITPDGDIASQPPQEPVSNVSDDPSTIPQKDEDAVSEAQTGYNQASTSAPTATKLPVDMTGEEMNEILKNKNLNADSDIGNEALTNAEGCKSVGVIVVKDGYILCGIRQGHTASGLICGPGGHVENGESLYQAAVRETEEEFGITPKSLYPLGRGTYEPESGLTPYIFLCQDYEGTPECDCDEIFFAVFRSLGDLYKDKAYIFEPFANSLNLLQALLISGTSFTSPHYRDDAEDEGSWITLSNGVHVHISEAGVADKGPDGALSAINDKKSSGSSKKGDSPKQTAWKKKTAKERDSVLKGTAQEKSDFAKKHNIPTSDISSDTDEVLNEYFRVLETNGDPTPTKATTTDNADFGTVSDGMTDVYTYDPLTGEEEDILHGIHDPDGPWNTISEYVEKQLGWSASFNYSNALWDYWDSGKEKIDTETLDKYIAEAPAYEGPMYRGMTFTDSEYKSFMDDLRSSGTYSPEGKITEWTSDKGWGEAYSDGHIGGYNSKGEKRPEYNGVMLVCTANKTSVPANFVDPDEECLVLASSKSAWSVYHVEEKDNSYGKKQTVVYCMEQEEPESKKKIKTDSLQPEEADSNVDGVDDEGKWITLPNGTHIHLTDKGFADKGPSAVKNEINKKPDKKKAKEQIISTKSKAFEEMSESGDYSNLKNVLNDLSEKSVITLTNSEGQSKDWTKYQGVYVDFLTGKYVQPDVFEKQIANNEYKAKIKDTEVSEEELDKAIKAESAKSDKESLKSAIDDWDEDKTKNTLDNLPNGSVITDNGVQYYKNGSHFVELPTDDNAVYDEPKVLSSDQIVTDALYNNQTVEVIDTENKLGVKSQERLDWCRKVSEQKEAIMHGTKEEKTTFLKNLGMDESFIGDDADTIIGNYYEALGLNGNPEPSKGTIETNDILDMSDWKGSEKDYTPYRHRVQFMTSEYGISEDDAKKYTSFFNDFTGTGYQNESKEMIAAIDDYVDHAPAYDGVTYRGLNFGLVEDRYERFIKGIYDDGIYTIKKNTSWSNDSWVADHFSHWGCQFEDSVRLVCAHNRTSTPISYLSQFDWEKEIISSSKASWTVYHVDDKINDQGKHKTTIFCVESGSYKSEHGDGKTADSITHKDESDDIFTRLKRNAEILLQFSNKIGSSIDKIGYLLYSKSTEDRNDGGKGSGNFGHKGVEGQIGGSAPSVSERGENAPCKGFYKSAYAHEHIRKHGETYPNMTLKQYEKHAIEFLTKPCKGNIEGYLTKDGLICRYNKQTGEYAKGKPGGALVTCFYPGYNKKKKTHSLEKANRYYEKHKKEDTE